MANVVDALVVTLGLDPSGLKKGEREAGASLRKMREDATRTNKDVEEVGKRIAQAMNSARNAAIGLFAVFIGGRGLSSFIRETSESGAALGRLSRDLGISARQLSAWEGVSQRVGNTAGELTGAFQNIQNRIQDFRLNANPGAIQGFRQHGIALAEGPNFERARSNEAIYNDVLRIVAAAPRAERLTRAQSMGFGQETVNLALAPNRAQMLREQQATAMTDEQTAALTRLREAMWRLWDAVNAAATRILTNFEPQITAIANRIREFVQYLAGDEFKPKLQELADAIKRFAEYLLSADFVNDLKLFRDAIKDVVDALTRALRWLGLIPQTEEEQAAAEARMPRGITGQLPGAPRTGAPAAAAPEPPRPGAMTDRQRQAYEYFVGRGWTPAQAAGIVGHLTGESGTGLNIDAFNPEGGGRGAMGIGQWRGPRIAAFERMYGRTPQGAPLEQQLEFVDWELRNTERAQGDALRNTNDPREAADLMFRRYGRPGADDRTGPRRQSNALGIWQRMHIPRPDPALQQGAQPGAAVQNKMWGGSTTSNEMSIGNVTVNTQATDAQGIARDIGAALKSHSFVNQMTYGLA